MPSLVLFSGGMDSTIALYHTLNRLKKEPELGPVHALCIDYGQRHVSEQFNASNIWNLTFKHYDNPGSYFKILQIPKETLPSVGSLLNLRIPVRKYLGGAVDSHDDPSFIPHRNLLLIVVAAMWARRWGAYEVITGIRGGFPDCTPKFEHAVMEALAYSDPTHPIELTSPVHIDRAASLHLATTLLGCWDALGYTLTCFEGTVTPCGQCLPCRKRAEGFEQLGMKDPLLHRLASLEAHHANQTKRTSRIGDDDG